MSYIWYQKGKELLNDIENFHFPEIAAGIWYIGQMGTILRWNGKTICVDPVLGAMGDAEGTDLRNYPIPFAPEECCVDYIFCTHDHADHMHTETLVRMADTHPELRIFLPEPVVRTAVEAGIPEKQITGVSQLQVLSLDRGISVRPVATAHESYRFDESGNSETLGYVFRLGTLKIFHAGDTVVTDGLIQDLCMEQGLDAALLPINGRDIRRNAEGIIGNMDSREAGWFGEAIDADLLIPMHFDMIGGNEENPLIFADYMERYYPGRRYHILRLGEGFILNKRRKAGVAAFLSDDRKNKIQE